MYKFTIALFSTTIFLYADAGFVDGLPKCMISDNECLRGLYESIFRKIGKSGISEFNVPPVDPIKLYNVTVNIPDVIDINLIEGVAKGVKDCKFEKLTLDVKKGNGFNKVTCDIVVKGRYNVTSSFGKYILGGNTVHGKGNGKVSINKLSLSFEYTWYPQRRDDGKTYMKFNFADIDFDYDIKGNTMFDADSLYMGDQDIIQIVLPILNEYSDFIMKYFGKAFMNKAMEFYFLYAGNAFDKVPMESFIIDMENVLPYSKP